MTRDAIFGRTVEAEVPHILMALGTGQRGMATGEREARAVVARPHLVRVAESVFTVTFFTICAEPCAMRVLMASLAASLHLRAEVAFFLMTLIARDLFVHADQGKLRGAVVKRNV